MSGIRTITHAEACWYGEYGNLVRDCGQHASDWVNYEAPQNFPSDSYDGYSCTATPIYGEIVRYGGKVLEVVTSVFVTCTGTKKSPETPCKELQPPSRKTKRPKVKQ